MRHKLSHPMFPLCKPGREQHNNDSSFTDQRSNTRWMCSCLSFMAGQAALIPPIPLPFLYLSLSLTLSLSKASGQINTSFAQSQRNSLLSLCRTRTHCGFCKFLLCRRRAVSKLHTRVGQTDTSALIFSEEEHVTTLLQL